MRSAIVARVRDRNPMEVADDLGHRFWRLLPLWPTIRARDFQPWSISASCDVLLQV